jgi:hypothetical protein
MELDMRSTIVGVAALTFAAIAGCSSSTAPSNCYARKTTVAYRNAESFSVTVTSLSVVGSSQLVEASNSSGPLRFLVSDTTPVFIRVGSGTPRAAVVCELAVGDVVEIPFGDGFGDFSDPVPTLPISQVVIDR